MSFVAMLPSRGLAVQRALLAVAVACGLIYPAAAEDVESPDIIAAPQGSTAEILAFIDELTAEEPQAESEEELRAAELKVLRSVAIAAEAALQAGPATPEEELKSYFFRLNSLKLLAKLDEPGAKDLLDQTIAAARASENERTAALAMTVFIQLHVDNWDELSKTQRTELVKEMLAYLETARLDRNDAQTVMTVADFFGSKGEYELGAELVKQALPLFEKAEFARREMALEALTGLGNRLSLPGHKMELDGALLDGTPLDWSQYEGKVVLVDFWATWCGPCRDELPNVLNMYKAYHDQGFEVLGISLDDDPAAAAAFIEKMGIPWATLFSEDESARGWEDPLAVKYGVNGIPLAFLLDREGKVVSMTARGANLKKLLFELLGPPGKAKDPAQQ